MIGRNPDKRDGAPADVDIAPLIDVVFLLIVFFMSIWQAAHIEVAAELTLPAADQGNPEVQQDRDRLIVNIDGHGGYHVSNQRYSKEGLAQILAREANTARDVEGFADRPIVIRADADLPFGDVREVMMMCRDVRIWKLSFRTRGPIPEMEP